MTGFDGAILDVDGTVLRGADPIPGAAEAITKLRDRGCAVVFVTNNPTVGPAVVAERLRAAGIDADPREVLTSGGVTADFLADDRPDDDLFVVGEVGLREQLSARDLSLTDDYAAADTLVASIDREFTYDRLKTALWSLADESVGFVGTDPDRVIPTADGLVPGSGAIINAVADVAGREPEAVLGKPHEVTRAAALDRLGVDSAQCVVVGDRLDTDVALATGTDMTTVLTLTGVSDRTTVEASEFVPDHVVSSLADVPALW
ncbi:HAD-IIA family hydrolase [Haloarchaeobius sp. DFWS5]|uniref:HAD-IIA family hydrolase n=1 Tax=Haloarchaeobius sp. DFWS5 TaxID=3446114 RepID=UPI003EB7C587